MPDLRTPSGDADHVAAGLVATLPVLSRAIERHADLELPHRKPSDAQLALLRHVEAHDGVTVREAAEALLMKANNVSALVRQLTGLGLLERRQDPDDKRVAHLHLTATARREIAEVDQLMGAHVARALQDLTAPEVAALGAALDALRALNGTLHRPAP
ncbi:MarR family winged helix-turn-helix transcriptional regulator [Streptomyces sp. NPDC058052]|uniref:MarR family winged helix-turn-helix transcriptional regulator n=1 Tax=Streptomyces sp. NPDC058052 TaxID=3346316 RepID=UPI0036E539C8